MQLAAKNAITKVVYSEPVRLNNRPKTFGNAPQNRHQNIINSQNTISVCRLDTKIAPAASTGLLLSFISYRWRTDSMPMSCKDRQRFHGFCRFLEHSQNGLKKCQNKVISETVNSRENIVDNLVSYDRCWLLIGAQRCLDIWT